MLVLCLSAKLCIADDSSLTDTNMLVIQSLTVSDRIVPIVNKAKVRLSPSPENVSFNFGFTTNANTKPIRLIRKLDGLESSWNIGGGEMFLIVRFYGDTGNVIAKTDFEVHGDSAGWRNDFTSSALTHRREIVVVPPHASRLLIIVSSAGPQSTEGVYAVSDLTVSTSASNNESKVLLHFPSGQRQKEGVFNVATNLWVRDGINPSMAKTIMLGEAPAAEALEILDDDPLGHAEWHNNLEFAPTVTPGESLIIEWNEMYSIGESSVHFSNYPNLPPGNFVFRVRELDIMGVPTGIEASLSVIVPPPFWKTSWFRGIVAIIMVAFMMVCLRYIIWIKTRRKILLLEKQRLLERERLRIARDIHDDLGARVTQISLVSAMAHDDSINAKAMRSELAKISKMSRDLVTALYETVWTVNPENDNLKELGNYLFQIIDELCEQSQCRCRFQIDDLPLEITVLSHVRHNLCMAVKEAVNNVIKHANATEIKLSISFLNPLLTVSINDDGCGFAPSSKPVGHGLKNMKGRLEEIGGSCHINSQPGHGTTILICLKI